LKSVENADDPDQKTQRSAVEVEGLSPVLKESLYLKHSKRDENSVCKRIDRNPAQGPSRALREPIVIGIHPVHGKKYTRGAMMNYRLLTTDI